MKENILFIIFLFAGWAGMWYFRGELKDKEWREKLNWGNSKRDTSVSVRETKIPAQRETAKPSARSTASHERDVDSSLMLALSGARDTVSALRHLISFYTAPRETTVRFRSGDSLLHQSDRLRGIEIYTLMLIPRKDSLWTFTDSIFVPQMVDRAWYDRWYWGSLATAAVVILINKTF